MVGIRVMTSTWLPPWRSVFMSVKQAFLMGCERQTQRHDGHGTQLLPQAWSLSLLSLRSSSLCA